MARRTAVVVSQGQSSHPAKRGLEEDIVTSLLMEPGIDVTVIPNLYDLTPDGTGMLALKGIAGDMVLLSWLFPRAAHWILDRNGILGKVGTTLLESEVDEDSGEENEPDDKERVIDHRETPNRSIYCLDLRGDHSAATYVDEIKRIAKEANTQVVQLMDWIGGSPSPEQTERFLNPTNDVNSGNGNGQTAEVTRIEDTDGRRWYPVIDFSRCTNCMECIDFCLFGVYGVDKADTILVEQPDNCRKGCPACSRVCPENAIIFPQHKTPAIAGAPGVGENLKIDLSKLFGAPEEGKSAVDMAVLERDEQLQLAGREAVGTTVGIAKRQDGKADEPKDELDNLIDELDDFDL